LSSVPWRSLLKFRSTTAGGAEAEVPRYLIDNLLEQLGAGTPSNVVMLGVPSDEMANADPILDLSPASLAGSNVGATADNPPVIRGGVLSARLNGTDEYWEHADNALYSAVSGGVDVAFSVGCAFKMTAPNASGKTLISKYDTITPNLEWRVTLGADEKIFFRIVDDSVVNANRGRLFNTALDAMVWYVALCTYDGRGGASAQDGMSIYLWDNVNKWSGAVDDTDNVGAGVYVDMEDTVQPVMVGASDTAGGPAAAEFWPGEVVLPFFTRADLSGAAGNGLTYAENAARIIVELMGLDFA